LGSNSARRDHSSPAPADPSADTQPGFVPESLAATDGLPGLEYVKGENKVLLVRPSTGIAVDEVTM
jgi:hypothetical protein